MEFKVRCTIISKIQGLVECSYIYKPLGDRRSVKSLIFKNLEQVLDIKKVHQFVFQSICTITAC